MIKILEIWEEQKRLYFNIVGAFSSIAGFIVTFIIFQIIGGN